MLTSVIANAHISRTPAVIGYDVRNIEVLMELKHAVKVGCEKQVKDFVKMYGTDFSLGEESDTYGDLEDCVQDAEVAKQERNV